MARNAISLSTYALIDGKEYPCETDGRLVTKAGERPHAKHRRWDGPFKVRWREWVVDEGERTRAQRASRVSDVAALQDLHEKIRKALEIGAPVPEAEAREIQRVASLDEVAAGWIKWKRAENTGDSTIRVYKSALKRIFQTIRYVQRIPREQAVPVTALTMANIAEWVADWKGDDDMARGGDTDFRGCGPWRVYDFRRWLFEIWDFGARQPAEYPGVPPVPPERMVRGRAPARPPTPEAATWDEMDAILRRIYAWDLDHGDLCLGERGTGLRISQLKGIRRRAVIPENAILVVEVGKSEVEKLEQRLIPVPRWLIDAWAPRIGRCKTPDDFLFPARRTSIAGTMALDQNEIKRIWREAEAAGEVRRDTFEPRGHRKGRVTHGFRAGYMRGLEELNVEVDGVGKLRVVQDKVIDYLVGHHPRTTRDRNYVRPSLEQLRMAVGQVPAPKLGGIEGGNIVAFPTGK